MPLSAAKCGQRLIAVYTEEYLLDETEDTDVENTYEMLPQQRKIWNIEMAYPGTDICNIGGYLHLEDKYDTELLQKTFDIFMRNQSSFWTKVNRQGRLYFDRIRSYRMEEYDLTDLTENETDALIRRWICEPFSLYDAYLFDFRLLRLRDKTVIFEKFHHLIADGYAVSLCAKYQEKIYEQLEAGESEFATDERPVREIMEGCGTDQAKTRIIQKSLDSGSFVSLGGRVSDPKAEVLSAFITDKGQNGEEAKWYKRTFDYKGINAFCRKYRVSVEALFYGCLGVYLCRTRDCEGLAVGRNLLNRAGEDMTVVALKVDTLTFEIRPDWELPAAGYLAELKKRLAKQTSERLSIAEHADIEISYRPVRYLPAPKKGECREYQNSSVEVPVKLFINDNGREIELVVKYQTEILNSGQVRKLVWKMLYIMDQILANPEIRLGGIELLEEPEKSGIEKFNASGGWQYKRSLPERYLGNVNEHPGRTALIYKGKTYSYAESYAMTNKVRRIIEERAEKNRGNIIGLCLRRSPWLPAAIYAVWLSGYTFLPVSPRESGERQKKISDSCALLITDQMLRQYKGRSKPGEPEVRLNTELPAYEMYTSGTTGTPKAVMISHRSLSCRLEWMEEVFGNGTEVILQKTRSTFDVSVWELVLPFAFGKTLCVLEEGKEACPDVISEEMARSRVTIVHFVPSMFAKFLSYIRRVPVRLPDLRYIILSGEALGAEQVKEAKRLLPHVEVYNLYGPTECTIDVSYYRCTGEEQRVPIGRPVYNTSLTVRNKKGEILPIGETGELVVEGSLVGMGYDGETETSGYCEIDGKRAYRTGDLAVLGEDGLLYYEGRMDQQVKVRGMRVNPIQIEQTLNRAIPGTRNVVLCIREQLVDFYQGTEAKGTLRTEAGKVLPYYCVPSEFIRLEDIPIGKHGKADREQLKKLYECRLRRGKEEQKFSMDWEIRRREELLLQLAQKILDRRDIGVDSNLLDKGMDSLTALNYLLECEQYGIPIKYEEIYARPSIRELAKNRGAAKPVIFLQKGQGERLILLVPFAGGSPLSFRKLSKSLSGERTDMAAVNLPSFREQEAEAVAERVLQAMPWESYGEVYLVGDCVGSALAMELSALMGERVKGIMLCEALPYLGKSVFGRVVSIWDAIPDEFLSLLLQRVRGKRFHMSREHLQCFRNDVRRSAIYLSKGKRLEICCRVTLVFGDEDGITAGYRKKYTRWRRWLPAPYRVYTIAHGRHFLTEDHPDRLAAIIRKEWFTEDREDVKGSV